MKKQTAVEWLANHWKKLQSEGEKMSWQQIIDITEAKEMEKEQSLNFAKHCLDKAKDLDVRTAFFNVEQYFNETFNTKEK
jgi:hypothetical protein